MLSAEQRWTVVLAAGVVLVGVLVLPPVFMPQPRVPTVTRTALPVLADASPAPEPRRYPRTASIEPLISGKLNLNTASQEQLEALPEVGPALAARIIAGRPYRSLADLDRVKGVGAATLRVLTPLVSF